MKMLNKIGGKIYEGAKPIMSAITGFVSGSTAPAEESKEEAVENEQTQNVSAEPKNSNESEDKKEESKEIKEDKAKPEDQM
jgi:Sec-independent protein translocase protein TatA